MSDEENTNKAYAAVYTELGRSIPNGILNSAPMDDQHAMKTLRLENDGTRKIDVVEDGNIQCSGSLKTSFLHSAMATIDVTCEKDGVALKNNLSGAEQDQAIEAGMNNQYKGYRGNPSNASVPSGRK